MKAFKKSAGLRVARLRVERQDEGQILQEPRPLISWEVDGEPRAGLTVDTVEIERQSADASTERAQLRADGRPQVRWPFSPLRSRETGRVRVRLHPSLGQPSAWSAWTDYAAGLYDREDWTAEFITPVGLGGLYDPAPVLFRRFDLDESSHTAKLWITARGVYDVTINGARVSDDLFAPGWTAYDKRLRYQVLDVAKHLRAGENTIEVILGNGWYRGHMSVGRARDTYGSDLALRAQLELTDGDGMTRTIATDSEWRSRSSHILSDDLYDGETVDLRIPRTGRASEAAPVRVLPAGPAELVARRGAPVRVTGTVAEHRRLRSARGSVIVDLGQNVVGQVRLRLRDTRPGQELVVRHAEVLDGGELALAPLRSAKATCRYLLAGAEEEIAQPTFTFSGFRYVEIDGVEAEQIAGVTALVIGSDLERTGTFGCSDPRVNQLHSNVVWSARGNFLDIPTDCPQRDERLGWTGDIQVFAPTAHYLFDTSGFLAGWLEDLAAEQHPDGAVPFVVPDILRDPAPMAAGWGDAAASVPLSLYETFADESVLRRQYASMRHWVDAVTRLTDPSGVWHAEGQFGDWLDPTAPPTDAAAVQADPSVVATAYYIRSARHVAVVADVLGDTPTRARFRDLAAHATAGFRAEFVTADGRITSDCQTVYALALAFDLLTEDQRALAAARLAELVEAADFTIATGFLGTPHILDALCAAGYEQHAYRMLLQTAPPSWLYAVERGATTVWERWDSLRPDGSINASEMTSFNHYAYGSVADWMHRTIAGLTPLEPGYRRFRVQPRPGGGITSARTSFSSIHGLIEVEWTLDDNGLRIGVTVPFGTEADVWLPGEDAPVTLDWGVHEVSRDPVPAH